MSTRFLVGTGRFGFLEKSRTMEVEKILRKKLPLIHKRCGEIDKVISRKVQRKKRAARLLHPAIASGANTIATVTQFQGGLFVMCSLPKLIKTSEQAFFSDPNYHDCLQIHLDRQSDRIHKARYQLSAMPSDYTNHEQSISYCSFYSRYYRH